mgnify:CR=1 FL=1
MRNQAIFCLFPIWELFIPSMGTCYSQHGNLFLGGLDEIDHQQYVGNKGASL